MRDPDIIDDEFDTESMRGGSLFEYIEVLRRRWAVVLTAIVVVTIAGVAFAKKQKKMFVSSTSLAVSTQTLPQAGSGGGGGSNAGANVLDQIEQLSGGRSVETQAAILSSPDLLTEAFTSHERFLDSEDQNTKNPKDINNTRPLTKQERMLGFGVDDRSVPVLVPKWCFDVEQKKGVDLITVNITSYDALLGAILANRIVETYLAEDLKRNKEAAEKGANYVAKEMKNIRGQLETASRELAAFAKKTKIVDPLVQVQALTKDLLEAQLDLDKTHVAAIAGRVEVANLEEQIRKLSPEIDIARTIERNPDFEQARARISNLEGQLASQSQIYPADAPEIRQIRNALAEEKKNIKAFSEKFVFSRTLARNPALDKVVSLYAEALGQAVLDEEKEKGIAKYVSKRNAEFELIPEIGRQYGALKEEVDNLLRTYSVLSDKYYELLIQKESSVPSGFVVSRAPVPLRPSFPNMMSAGALSLLLGIIAGILAAMILERLDTRIHDPALVERITGLTVLTAVPEVKSTGDAASRSLTIGSSDAPSGFAESFRLLRNNIAFSSPDQVLKIIAVTSAGKGDGKSTTSVNLAIAMAMDGNRVLLVDADLRRPALHKYLSLSREVGFTNVVRGNVTLENAILPTAFDNVSCLTTGPLPPSPSEFLNSSQARVLFEKAVELYDFVLVDCPPCTGLSDIQVISTLVQGIVLVVALDVTEKQYLAGAIRLLRLAGAPVLGMVLNRVRYSRSNYYYYSYYYYYGYYGEDETEEKNRKKGRRPPKD